MKQKDIIVVGLQPWDIAIGSNCKNIAVEFAKNNRVLYVNRALDRITYLKPKKDALATTRLNSLKGRQPDINLIQENLWTLDPRVILESINWIRSPRVFDWLNYLNNKRLANAIRDAAKRLGFKNPVIFIDNDFIRYQYLGEMLKGREGVIYYIRDYLLAHPYFKRHGERLEPQIMRKSTLVVANSSYLADYAGTHNQHAADIGQGCELDTFLIAQSEVPESLAKVKGIIVGYTGALVSYRLDQDLLYALATRNPDWTIALVGPEDEAFKNGRLHGLPNVLFTGSRPAAELPAYINRFDVCINPQLLTEITVGNYPRKIDEYLAMGKAVVATNTPAMRMFNEYVYLAEDVASYEECIKLAIAQNGPGLAARRRAFALQHTWPNSVKALYSAYEKVAKN